MTSRLQATNMAIALVLGFGDSPTNAQKVYWADRGQARVQRANLDGSGVETVLDDGGSFLPYGLAIDVCSAKMYWTEGADTIQRANFDGSDVEDLIVGGLEDVTAIALDVEARQIYWIDNGQEFTADAVVRRADLDGTNVETLVATGLSQLVGIALDVIAMKIYWTDSGSGRIQRANFDGSNIETLVEQSSLGGIALDISNGQMYWGVGYPTSGSILRANLDGSGVESMLSTDWKPDTLALDVLAGKIYWSYTASHGGCIPSPCGSVSGIFKAKCA